LKTKICFSLLKNGEAYLLQQWCCSFLGTTAIHQPSIRRLLKMGRFIDRQFIDQPGSSTVGSSTINSLTGPVH
jgi:hypothetical protein